jgi:type I restriction enzyme M protein
VNDLSAAVWSAATALRDRLDAGQVRTVVLTLVALRALSLRSDRPDGTPWERLRTPGAVAEAIERWREHDPLLREALAPIPDVLPERLSAVHHAVDQIDPHAPGDPLGDLSMVLIRHFARAEGRRGGQYYTPPPIVDLLVALVAPVHGVVYDPACGSGGLLLRAHAHAAGPTQLIGQEINPSAWRLARLSANLRNIPIDLGARPEDTLNVDLHPGLCADRILANPPFNLAQWTRGPSNDDPRWRLGRPDPRNANFAWLQHILHHLSPDGLAAIILANTSLTSARERQQRRAALQTGRVQGIISLPDRLFWTTSVPASVWVLGPALPTGVLAVDARGLGGSIERGVRDLPDSAVLEIAALFQRHRAGEVIDTAGLARSVPLPEALERSSRFVPGAFVGVPEPSVALGGDSADPVDTLTALFAQSHALDVALLDALRAIRDRS